MGVFNQRFEALFPCAGALGCMVCFAPLLFLPVYLCMNVGTWYLLAAAWPAPFHNRPPRWVGQLSPCRQSSLPWLPVSARFQSLPALPTIILDLSGAASWVGGFVYILGPCGCLQQTLLWGWEFLQLLPQPLRAFSIRGLRLYFLVLEPWAAWSVSLPFRSSRFIHAPMWGHRVCQPPPYGVC